MCTCKGQKLTCQHQLPYSIPTNMQTSPYRMALISPQLPTCDHPSLFDYFDSVNHHKTQLLPISCSIKSHIPLFISPCPASSSLIFVFERRRSSKSYRNMGRGVSSGGGQSSLGYLFGSGEAPKSATQPAEKLEPANKLAAEQPVDNIKQTPAGIQGNQANNYFRAEGQNCGNFITDRPSTKVHAAPGGGSSLDYLFGNDNGGK